MSDAKRWIGTHIVGNPVYILSAAVMMYGIAQLLGKQQPFAGDVVHVLSTYGALQLYELAIVGLSIWILTRLVVPEDGATLLVLESLLLGIAFIALDELFAAGSVAGLCAAGVGMVLAGVKLALTRRLLGIQIGVLVRLFAWSALALPIAWVLPMKSLVGDEILAQVAAYHSWWSVAAVVIVAAVLGWFRRQFAGEQLWPSAILAGAVVLTVGAHLFSLHHSFLAAIHLWYPAPVVVAVGFAAMVAAPRSFTRVSAFIVSWILFAPLILFGVSCGTSSTFWSALPGDTQPEIFVRLEILALYACLLVMTRKRIYMLHVLVAACVAFGRQREFVWEHLSKHTGWWLVAAAFVLLALGAWVSRLKHRARQPAARQVHSPTSVQPSA